MMKESIERSPLCVPDHCPEIRDLKTLTGCIVHDINNILMAIKGNISLIRVDCARNQAFARRLDNMDACIQNASELTQEVLGFIKNETVLREKINLNIIIKRIIRVYGRILKGVSIESEYEKDILKTNVNRSQIERVILNLLINAWKAMPRGGKIFICTKNVSTSENLKLMKANQFQAYVKITVADTGNGMDPDTQTKIFEPFFSNHLDRSGIGMGMTSVGRIIDAHGGFIQVNSQPNHGATFDIFMPVSES